MEVPVTVLRTGGPGCVLGSARPVPWLAETYLAGRGVVEQVRIWRGRQRAGRNQDRTAGVRTSSLRKTADTWLSTVQPDKTSRVAISVLRSPDASSRSTSVSRRAEADAGR